MIYLFLLKSDGIIESDPASIFFFGIFFLLSLFLLINADVIKNLVYILSITAYSFGSRFSFLAPLLKIFLGVGHLTAPQVSHFQKSPVGIGSKSKKVIQRPYPITYLPETIVVVRISKINKQREGANRVRAQRVKFHIELED